VRIKPHTFGGSQDGKEGILLRIKEFDYEGVKKIKYVWLMTQALEKSGDKLSVMQFG
jgi:hypothetical protein